ncbi:MAG: ABC transporter ATP-binding protein [Bacteroidetes bacterium]|nr:ABC transporter ATP-binding protein [Bacteroidota bacterium]
MKALATLLPFAWKYRFYLMGGLFFVFISNYFNVLTPQLTSFIIDHVQRTLQLPGYVPNSSTPAYDGLVLQLSTTILKYGNSLPGVVALCGITLLVLALLRGFFLFLMRQTIIVMSRHIEYEQKNQIYSHYQSLDISFLKQNRVGDLMNRIAEDVARVRLFTGPAIMYIANLIAVISLCVYFMFSRDSLLALYVLAPLPALAILIYFINNIINQRSERIQEVLSDLTAHAQESYAGIRVIKSFSQERSLINFYQSLVGLYRKEVLGLVKVEALYFPSITLLIGISTLLTIMIGGLYYINGNSDIGVHTIVEFVMYINMLTFPVSAIGLTASMVQRAAASQKRINEFMQVKPTIITKEPASKILLKGDLIFKNVNFTYPETGIHALKQINIHIKQGERVLVMGKTGSGKSTLLQLILRYYNTELGGIFIGDTNIANTDLLNYRNQIGYVPQDSFLFSDTIAANISFGQEGVMQQAIEWAANAAAIDTEITQFPAGYQTLVGERGVTLSGGQKQRISLARALVKKPMLLLLDDCLSAVDSSTEQKIATHFTTHLKGVTQILVSHRVHAHLDFDRVIILENGEIIEMGSPTTLLSLGGVYQKMAQLQRQ